MGEYIDPKSVSYTDYHTEAVLGIYGDVEKLVTMGYWSGELRLDIRKWKDGKLGKGISLDEEEVRRLRAALDKIEFGK